MPVLTKKPGDYTRASGTVTNTGNQTISDCKVALYINLTKPATSGYGWVGGRYSFGSLVPGSAITFTKDQVNIQAGSVMRPATYYLYLSVVDTDPATWEYLFDTGYTVNITPAISFISYGAGLYLCVDTFYNGIQTGTTLPTYSPGSTGGCAFKFNYYNPFSASLRWRVYVYDWWNKVQLNCKDVTINFPPSVESAGRSGTVYSTNDNFGYWSDSTHPLSWLNVSYILDNFVLPQANDFRLWRILQQGSEVIYRSEYAVDSNTLGMKYGYNSTFTLPGVQPNWRSGDSFLVHMEVSQYVYDYDSKTYVWYPVSDMTIGNIKV